MEEQQESQTKANKLKSFIIQSKRVLKITRKPGKEELKMIVKVTGIGMLIIGAIGFLIHIGGTLLLQ